MGASPAIHKRVEVRLTTWNPKAADLEEGECEARRAPKCSTHFRSKEGAHSPILRLGLEEYAKGRVFISKLQIFVRTN